MMYGPIRAVAIDDRPTHLLAIGTGLAAVGIPCMSYWYDRGSSKLVPAAKPHEFLRLVFMDLNLAELGGNPDPKNLAGVVMDVLGQIVSPEGGPYLLIFWTEVTGKVEEVKRVLYERLEGIPAPLDVVELSKREFLPVMKPQGKDLDVDLQALFTSLTGTLGNLAKEVERLTGTRPELSVVSGWESRATEAAARAVNEVVNHARTDVKDTLEVGDSMKRVLATIAREAAGQTRAETEPARALDAGMAEILNDQFSVSVEDDEYTKVVRTALEPAIKARTKFGNAVRMAAALNTFFHVDVRVGSAKTSERGVVLAGKSLFTEKLLGGTHVDLLRNEFTFITKEAADFEKEAELVLVEAGADCDHAQAKPRTLRYLVAFEIPQKHIDLVRSKKEGKLHSPALQLLGPWDINGGIFLLVSCRRFFTWQDNKPPEGTVKYRLRNSVVNKLLHHYSTWSSRPGIVEFHP